MDIPFGAPVYPMLALRVVGGPIEISALSYRHGTGLHGRRTIGVILRPGQLLHLEPTAAGRVLRRLHILYRPYGAGARYLQLVGTQDGPAATGISAGP